MSMADDLVRHALNGLRSEREEERLDSARELLENVDATPVDLDQPVREAFARETVPWIKGVLAEILAAVKGERWEDGVAIPAPSWNADLEGLDAETAREVINRSTRRVLHEVAAVVGRAKLAAAADLADGYEGSETARQLSFLSDVCAGLRTLSAATQAPDLREFDLASELAEIAEAIAAEWICPIHVNGSAPFILTCDRALLSVAVRNILVNAIEATLAVGPAEEARAVVVTWGISAAGFHVTVIDRGAGPPRFLAAVQKAGVSTKPGHAGYGLATASEAMSSLGGSVHVRRNDRGGATIVLGWPDTA
jgi:signal transduction histidine kinase